MDASALGASGLCAMPTARVSCARIALANSPSVRAMHLARSSRARALACSAPGVARRPPPSAPSSRPDAHLPAKNASASASSSSRAIHARGSSMTRRRSAS